MDNSIVDKFKYKIKTNMDNIKKDIYDIADYLFKNPEVGGNEYNSVRYLKGKISRYGFDIKQVDDLPTAFIARKSSRINGPKVALIAEYDALPELGHACGHNIIAASSFGAAAALGMILDELNGEVKFIGAPAEENLGYKTHLIKKGVFNDVDIALMIHPFNKTTPCVTSLALKDIEFSFKGKAAHAAIAPHLGINALDAIILLYNNINSLRQYMKSDVKIHGIITDGGKAPNIIPDSAKAHFFVRASTKNYLNEIYEKIINCGKASELATGAKLSYKTVVDLDDLISNKTLADDFAINLNLLGYKDISYDEGSIGSTDMGSVSHIVPSIQPFIGITKEKYELHTKEFCSIVDSIYAKEMAVMSAKALAMTGLDVLTNKELLKKIKNEFDLKK